MNYEVGRNPGLFSRFPIKNSPPLSKLYGTITADLCLSLMPLFVPVPPPKERVSPEIFPLLGRISGLPTSDPPAYSVAGFCSLSDMM